MSVGPQVEPNTVIPVRPYNTTIVTSHKVHCVPRDLILDANERLGALKADKGKGTLINNDFGIS